MRYMMLIHHDEAAMAAAPQKELWAEYAAFNEALGKAKQGIGEATGSDRLQGEGAVQEVKGKGQKALGDAKQATKDAVNDAAAAANKNL